MAVRDDYTDGTITLTFGSTDFTTSGSALVSADIRPGDQILLPAKGLTLLIDTITGENAGKLSDPCPASAAGVNQKLRIRFQADGQRYSAASQSLMLRLRNGNVDALASLTGDFEKVPMFTGPGAMELVDKFALTNGVTFDASVPTLADRIAFDAYAKGYKVLVSNAGDGRAALYTKKSNALADWSVPSYITGPVGPPPNVSVDSTDTLAPGTNATVTNVGTATAPKFKFGVPRGEGFSNKGAYSGTIAYVKGDVVTYNGSSYIANGPALGNLPTDATYWDLLAKKGLDGTGTGDVIGPNISVDARVAVFDGTTGKLVKDGGKLLSELFTAADYATARINLRRQDAAKKFIFLGGSNRPGPYGTGLSGGITGVGRTFTMRNTACRVRRDSPALRVTIPILANSGDPANGIRVQRLKTNGASYDVLGESDLIKIGTGTGLKTFTIPGGLQFNILDQWGLYMTGGSGPLNWSVACHDATSSSVAGWSVDYVEKKAASGDTWINATDLILPAWIEGPGGIIATTGDSIIEGHPNFHSEMHVGYELTGNRNNDIFYHVRNLLPGLAYQNHGLGGATWATVRASLLAAAVYYQPCAYFLYCGVNDIVAGRTWIDVETDIYAILNAIPAGAPVFISEMIPYSGPASATDAVAITIRDWNARYATIAANTGITLVKCWDQMGQIRASTGQKDDLIAAYNTGDGHLTTAGNMKLAQVIAPQIPMGL